MGGRTGTVTLMGSVVETVEGEDDKTETEGGGGEERGGDEAG